MNNKLYIVISIQENGKRYAYAHKQGYSNNLLNLSKIKGVEILQPCESWKKAKETAERWNAAYKANNDYLFDCPRF